MSKAEMTTPVLKPAYDASEPRVYYATDVHEMLAEIDRKAEAGLCYFTLTSAREFLKDIRQLIADRAPEALDD